MQKMTVAGPSRGRLLSGWALGLAISNASLVALLVATSRWFGISAWPSLLFGNLVAIFTTYIYKPDLGWPTSKGKEPSNNDFDELA